ncbi:hypothetical protein H4219_003824 [Mycoemilia scoparia]|uniref:Uncharacterized protein n=1 Tax=Mycoemilia scoparia TaxID=417184 RepID=A0A9W8DSU1_9FUNG|nr:hypothetical protein H4219_003824 [Mycoemilia scoparia]
MGVTKFDDSNFVISIEYLERISEMTIAAENRLLGYGLTYCQIQEGIHIPLLKWGFSSCLCSIGNGQRKPFGYEGMLQLSIKFIEDAEAISTKSNSKESKQTIEVLNTNRAEYNVHIYCGSVALLQTLLMLLTVCPYEPVDEGHFLDAFERLHTHYMCNKMTIEPDTSIETEHRAQVIGIYLQINKEATFSFLDMLTKFVNEHKGCLEDVVVKVPTTWVCWCDDFTKETCEFVKETIEDCFRNKNIQSTPSI